MSVVKGSKQHQMVVVRRRPQLKVLLWSVLLIAFGAMVYLSFLAGEERGLALQTNVVDERDRLRDQLRDSENLLRRLRQQVADVQVGQQIDVRANEEVRGSIEELQSTIADLSEEIRFYKSVMMPGSQDKGLRIERLELREGADRGRFGYKLLLVQVVDKHEFVQGTLDMDLLGMRNGQVAAISFGELVGEAGNLAGFRFRYFENFDGDFSLPQDFEPTEVLVKVKQSDGDQRRIERRFAWRISE